MYISAYPTRIRCAVVLAPYGDSNLTKPATVPPFMVIVRSADTTVGVSAPYSWFTNLTSPAKEYWLIPKADHPLGLFTAPSLGIYPEPTAYATVLNHTVSFLTAHINYLQSAPVAGLPVQGSAAFVSPMLLVASVFILKGRH